MSEDERIVERQIGRPPRGMARVEARCAFGYPTVIAVDPLVAHRRGRGPAEPFPTRYWLTCPILVEQVSRLEAAGHIARLEEEVASDPGFAERVRADHRRYAEERFAALTGPAREEAERRGLLDGLRDGGVAGTRDPASVKCLHAHYAHHLVRGNAVGAALAARHSLLECDPGSVRCDAFASKPREV